MGSVPVRLSVLVPTVRRPDVLARTLDHLGAQEAAPEFEVLVGIDGDHDYAPAALVRREKTLPYPLRVSREGHRGHGATLNRLLHLAEGAGVVVIGDDQFAAPGFLAAHARRLDAAGDPRIAVQGKVAWHPEVLPDPFLDWDRRKGILFAFDRMTPGTFVDPRFLYTSNISFDRDWLRSIGGFVEDLPWWTDTIFAFRAAKRGLRVLYEPAALVHHHDRWTLERECRRRYLKGRLAAAMLAEDPAFADHVELPRLNTWRRVRHRASRLARPWAERVGPRVLRDWCWAHAVHYHFAAGLADAEAGRPDPESR